jgi:hypothetical protein
MKRIMRDCFYTEKTSNQKAAFLLVAVQGCLTGKAALWYNLSSLAFLVIAGRGRMKGRPRL